MTAGTPCYLDENGLHESEQIENDGDFDVGRLYTRELPGGCRLVIDSFRDRVELVPSGTYESIFVRRDRSDPYWGYYATVLGGSRESVISRHEAEIASSEKMTQVVICPTYDCNSRCVYCYQQRCIRDRSVMDAGTLERCLEFARGKFSDGYSGRNSLQVFGGEVFLPGNRACLERIFEFCRENGVAFNATSNLVQMFDYAPMLLKYRGYIGGIYTTIDGGREVHNSRRISLVNDDPFDDIVRNINFLLDLEVHVTVAINLDRGSLPHLGGFLETARDNGWADNPLVTLEIGRVDDRFFEGCADDVMNEAELLEFLLDYRSEHGLPGNVRFAFMRAIAPLARLMGALDSKEPGRTRLNYCWASSPVNRVYYVDKNLDVFRCTYCVGRHSETLGRLGDASADRLPVTHIYGDDECWHCEIGGFCAGGCPNSRRRDKNRVCREERENFGYFVDHVLVPWLMSEYGGTLSGCGSS